MDTEIYSSFDEEETFQLGVDFSGRLTPGEVVAFFGDLGAGKTEFIKGICQGMNVEEIVSSPTYTIVNQYSGEDRSERSVDIYHVDLYRIENAKELIELGLADLMADAASIKLIEWAENAESILPPVRYDIYFVTLDDENSRRIEIVHRDNAAVETSRHVYSR
jgi:tRNA threonylcarbamoyladenosine biosynthesis protein TsaE